MENVDPANFLCRTMALYRRGTSSCRRSGSPARRHGLSLWRAVSGCTSSWTRQQNSTTCCPLSLRTRSARFWTWSRWPPAATPYTFLRARLLETHSLSNYEKWDMLQKTEQMGGRKPFKLLADMMEFCPAGLEQSLPFHYLFTHTLHAPTASAVAAVSSSEVTEASGGACATIRGGSKGYRGRGGQQRGRGGAKSITVPAASSAAPAAAAPKDPTPSALARFASGLCFFHWNLAVRATKCSPPCSWGN
jgi:hypothetical protein